MSSDHDQPQPTPYQVNPQPSGFGPLGQPLPRPIHHEQVRPVADVGGASIVLVCLTALTFIMGTAADWNTYRVVRDYLADKPGLTDSDLHRADSFTQIAGVLTIVLVGITAVVFLRWLRRARANAELLGSTEHRHSRGWVIGAWFCPIVNLWYPKQVVHDIWRGSDPADARTSPAPPITRRGGSIITLWWSTWIAGGIINWMILRRSGDPTVKSLHNDAILSTISTLLSLLATVALVVVIRQITTWQGRSGAARPADSQATT